MKKPGASILVVDDEREILRALQRSLLAHGYRVLTATNGEDALAAIAQQRPDLMVLDLLMPGVSASNSSLSSTRRCAKSTESGPA